MEIQLDLSKHCIETEIKRVYNQAIFVYFKTAKNRSRTTHIITLAKEALETFNFRRLRNEYPDLSGHSAAEIVLTRINGSVQILINGRRVGSVDNSQQFKASKKTQKNRKKSGV